MSETLSIQSELARGRGWVVILRGLTAIAFGILAFAWPGVTNSDLIVLFGIYALVHGVLSIAAAIGTRGQRGCLLLGTEGIVGLLTGILIFRTGSPSPVAFVLMIWLWAIATGILRLVEAVRLRKDIPGDIWLMLSGLIPVLFGGMLVLRPIIGAVGLALLIAASALLWGIFEVLLGWELREIRNPGRQPSRS